MNPENEQLIGIIPAAGRGSRVFALPGSKEMFLIGYMDVEHGGSIYRYPKTIFQYLIESMRAAGITRMFVVLSNSKWDIFKYFGDGSHLGVNLAYLSDDEARGMPYSINKLYPWIDGSTVIFGMPDTIIKPLNAFERLLNVYRESKADLTLGLFPTKDPSRFGMVEINHLNQVLKIVDKPKMTELKFLWGFACWGSKFSDLLDQEIRRKSVQEDCTTEFLLGDFFQTAVDTGLLVNACVFEDGEYIDIGDPKELEWAIKKFSR